MEKLGWQFDMLYCVLEKCLSDGVEESERSCLTSACSIISPVSMILLYSNVVQTLDFFVLLLLTAEIFYA